MPLLEHWRRCPRSTWALLKFRSARPGTPVQPGLMLSHLCPQPMPSPQYADNQVNIVPLVCPTPVSSRDSVPPDRPPSHACHALHTHPSSRWTSRHPQQCTQHLRDAVRHRQKLHKNDPRIRVGVAALHGGHGTGTEGLVSRLCCHLPPHRSRSGGMPPTTVAKTALLPSLTCASGE